MIKYNVGDDVILYPEGLRLNAVIVDIRHNKANVEVTEDNPDNSGIWVPFNLIAPKGE
jgi:hypothetical protein